MLEVWKGLSMTYSAPQVLASYSLEAAMSTCSSSGTPAGDIFAQFGNNCGYISSPTLNGNLFQGTFHSLI
jgi:hypothetical protein